MEAQEDELLEMFASTLTKLWNVDPNLTVLPWRNFASAKAISSKKHLPKSKEMLLSYVDRIFIRHNNATYVRIILAHNIKCSKLEANKITNWLHSKDMFL